MLGLLINKQSGIPSKLTPHSVLAAAGTVGSWQPGIKQCLQQEKERKQVSVRPEMPSVKHPRAQEFPMRNQPFLPCAVGSGLDVASKLLSITSGWWLADVRTPV